MYVFSPRLLWPALDSLSPRHLPGYMETVLKGEDPAAHPHDALDSARFNCSNFTFPTGTGCPARAKTCGLDGHLCTANKPAWARCVSALRADGMSVTSAFSALGVKAMAHLLVASGAAMEVREGGGSICGGEICHHPAPPVLWHRVNCVSPSERSLTHNCSRNNGRYRARTGSSHTRPSTTGASAAEEGGSRRQTRAGPWWPTCPPPRARPSPSTRRSG